MPEMTPERLEEIRRAVDAGLESRKLVADLLSHAERQAQEIAALREDLEDCAEFLAGEDI